MLDPLNEEVRACEQRILSAQEESYRAAEEERRAAEEALRRKQEEELRRLTEAERERLVREQEEVVEQEKKLNREKIERHLARAREHVAARSYHDALAEVAQAFTVDPFDEDVRAVEKEVLDAQKREGEAPLPQAPPAQQEGGEELQAEGHLEEARRLRTEGELSRALDEVTKAFAADPLNESVRALEAEIEAQIREAERLTGGAESLAPEEKNADTQKILYHIIRSRKLMEDGAYEDALAEVALGLTLDPENQDLRQMESTIWELRNGAADTGPEASEEENQRLVRLHIAAAEDFQQKGEFGRALDEIAKAYQIDPLNGDIKTMENRIRQEELRREHPGETPLKLVYPKKGAAGGSL